MCLTNAVFAGLIHMYSFFVISKLGDWEKVKKNQGVNNPFGGSLNLTLH